jgi:hypothetical protein
MYPFGACPQDDPNPEPLRSNQIHRAVSFVVASLEFYRKVAKEELSPDRSGVGNG